MDDIAGMASSVSGFSWPDFAEDVVVVVVGLEEEEEETGAAEVELKIAGQSFR